MVRLDIRLLGTFQATLDGEALTGFRSDKARALLAFLAVESTRPHRRDWLATLLWGNYDDRSARRSLSSALANLRQLLRPLGELAALDADRSDVWLRATGEAIHVDVAAWRELLAFTDTHAHRSLVHCQTCVAHLTRAAELYMGPFLSGLAFDGSPDFDEWQRAQQEALHQQALRVMGTLAAHHLASEAYSQAEHYARRQISLQPWHEEGHRQLMLALAGAGQRNAALTQYELCRTILASELSVEPEERTTALYHRIRSGAALSFSPQAAGAPPNPFRGLQSFREVDAADFYGRESVTRQLAEAVSRNGLVALIGPSGSGKSSVLHAGLVHQLRQRYADNARSRVPTANGKRARAWTICQVRPGSRPFHALAAAIAPHVKSLPRDAHGNRTDLADLLASGATSWVHLLNGRHKSPDGSRLLLLLDQFEELYTLCTDPDQRHAFVDLLLAAANPEETGASLSVLLAVRADFMGQVLSHRALADVLQDNAIMLGPMNRQELEDVIVKPAQAQGVRLQGGLVARLLNDVGQTPGRLPLLEFALTQLWERQEEGFLTHEAYEAIGQVEGALAGYAEQVYAALSPAEQVAARRVFTQMVQLGQDTEDTRRPLAATDVDAADWALIQRLADQRLVVTDTDAHGQQAAEIAHEALINGWGRLRHWINADRAFHLWQQRARLAADQWLDSGRDQGALLRGAPLAEAEGWSATRPEDLGPKVLELIAASQAQRQHDELEAEAGRQRSLAQAKALAEAEHQRAEVEASSNKRLRWLSASLSIVTLLALLAGLLAVLQRNEAVRQSDLAQAAQATADAERLIAEKGASLARARQLAAQSLNLAGGAPDLSILLALQSMQLNENAQEDTDFLLNLELSPLLGAVLHGQDSSVFCAAISPDGRVLATGGENGSIWLWDLEHNQPLGVPLTGHQQPVHALAWSPDGTRLVSGDRAGHLRFWDAPTRQPAGEPILAHTAVITAIVFTPDGRTVRTSGDDGAIKSWDAATGLPVGDALKLAGDSGLAFDVAGSKLVSSLVFTLTVQSASTGRPLGPRMEGHTAAIHDAMFNPDGTRLATASFDGTAVVWDIAKGQPLFPALEGHDGRVLAVAWSPDGTMLATGGTDSTIRLWDATTGEALGAPLQGHSNWVRSLVWTPDGRRLISGDAGGKIAVWEVGDVRRLPGHSSTVRGLAFSPDGRALASGSFDQTVLLRDVASGRELFPALQGHENSVLNVAYSPDGRYLVSASGGGELVRWDISSGQPIGQPLRGHAGAVAGLAISPDSRTIASGSFDNTFILWDAATGQPLFAPFADHTGWIISLAFSPDGRTVASGSGDTTIRLWDVATGEPIGQPLEGHTGWVTNLAWSPDGATLVSSSLDETVRFWDVASGKPAGEPLTGHHTPVWNVTFSLADGGRSLYSGDNSGTVIWWDVATRQALAPPLRTGIETESMAISPDGSTLAIGSFGTDGLVTLWSLPTVPWEQSACAIANRDLTSEEIEKYIGNTPYREICPIP
jgi:WD40 repeat protein/DNA-binding SARP family transcriptional activator